MTAIIERLPDHLMSRGSDAATIGREYLDVITRAIGNHPRSLQRRIGPSELGGPCARRLGYKLLDIDDANHAADPPWLPTIGTGVHAWLEDAFTQVNAGTEQARWLTELRVCVGQVGGVDVTGSCDLYDRVTATVIDHKIVGVTTLRRARSQGPGPQYRSQIHLYGRGIAHRGLPVDRVMIAFLPRNGELRDAYLWSEPYDEQVALDALQRVEGIVTVTTVLGANALAVLPTADAYCTRCPFYRSRSTDLSTGCPGHPGGDQEHRADSVLALVPGGTA